jgi:hypothetical protein
VCYKALVGPGVKCPEQPPVVSHKIPARTPGTAPETNLDFGLIIHVTTNLLYDLFYRNLIEIVPHHHETVFNPLKVIMQLLADQHYTYE